MPKPKKRPRLPGDPIEPGPSLSQRWVTWRITLGSIFLYIVYKAIDLGFEKLGG